MKFLPEDDTIVALSTPLGSGAIAVIRLSGPDSRPLVNRFLSRFLDGDAPRHALFAEFRAGDSRIDEVVATWFQGPRSYTGQDMVEITCHCNGLIIDRIIGELAGSGARLAEPGEFTLRAFLNGKMDLSQAEAVAEVIHARTRQSLNQSLRHLEGRLSDRIGAVKDQVLGYLSLLEINLDFSEDEIEVLPMAELDARIAATIADLASLLHTYDYGRFLQEGIKLLLLGKPNVGKSSLLNALLERERAIVSDIPGTTRDYIEAHLEIEGLAVQAVDTAGIRRTEDRVEAIGVERTLAQLESADIALALFEGHQELDDDDAVLQQIIEKHGERVVMVIVLNKADLAIAPATRSRLSELDRPVVAVSAVTGEGLPELRRVIRGQLLGDSSLDAEEVVVTSARHQRALQETITALQRSREAIQLAASDEIVAVDIRLALDHLGQITGETTSEDVLNHIFSSFCIGK